MSRKLRLSYLHSPVLPALPFLWSALAFDIQNSFSRCIFVVESYSQEDFNLQNWYIYRADIGYQRACSSALTLYPGSSFDIVPVDSNFKNKSPVLHVENCLGLESWCVKHVYMYCYSELMDKCFVKPKRKTPKSSVNSERLAQLLNMKIFKPGTSKR
ncbi:hypothetical protein MSG28_012255 [Choristoneura fumiferana]|uniref:Uncharacterized protein n=1 Tax=Choristoneura fumiferana TaxID=7141 RepID=A0ACC0KD52_CHOFU|nr:hypothetical protein MSG28_012255 [Choristoneura fumiferana]